MKTIEKAKPVTGMDVAKLLGVEVEYRDALLEQELNEGRERFINSDFEKENNSINPLNEDEK